MTLTAEYAVQRHWEEFTAGLRFPEVADSITFTKIASAPAATLDYFAVHHDPSAARSQGLPDIILSTIQIMGFIDRVVCSYAGPAAFVRKRTVSLRESISPGTRIVGLAEVVGRSLPSRPSDGVGLIDVAVRVCDQDGAVCCESLVSLQVPLSPAATTEKS